MLMFCIFQTSNTDDDVGDDADNDSWGDSDDGDLFDLPGQNCKKSEGVGYYYVDT